MPRQFNVVVAATYGNGIGINNKLPWTIPPELEHFRSLTTQTTDPKKQNAIIMGRKTFEGLPKNGLPSRLNIVITQSTLKFPTLTCKTLNNALALLEHVSNIEQIFVIGGARLINEAFGHPLCAQVILTRVQSSEPINVDIFINPIDSYGFVKATEERHITYEKYQCAIQTWTRKFKPNHEELQYIEIIRDILDTGKTRQDRTSVGTISKFGYTMRFDLSNYSIPLLTTKKVHFKSVAEELFWFLAGDTNANNLQARGVRIWEKNGSRAFLDSIGLAHREEGDLGPVYGFQWRHFGAEYKTMHDDYTSCGVDQIKQLIHQINTNPNDRRMILCAWNAKDQSLMALPPCHCLCQFYVSDGRLSCQMYQRSCDMGLGVPFNIASYALLTRLIAHVTNLQPGEFIHVLGDAHVYSNHVDALRKQIQRQPYPFPILRINPNVRDLFKIKYEDLTLENYQFHPKLEMDMAM